ncbi:hypothetical protein LX36DRAFT_138273 [Colletotrichum falcatum]|nr:hypothetical protein LX36DRAFT_138273 [Colletotrichum falcatum]
MHASRRAFLRLPHVQGAHYLSEGFNWYRGLPCQGRHLCQVRDARIFARLGLRRCSATGRMALPADNPMKPLVGSSSYSSPVSVKPDFDDATNVPDDHHHVLVHVECIGTAVEERMHSSEFMLVLERESTSGSTTIAKPYGSPGANSLGGIEIGHA